MFRPRAAPSEGEVVVATADPGTIEPELARARYLHMLSPAERAQHERFRFDDDRHTYLVAHALVRSVLAGVLDVAPAAVELAAGEHGKPELKDPAHAHVRFNLSHTRGMVACAIALRDDVGVDVEQIDRKLEIDSLARSVLSEDERAALAPLVDRARRERFFRHWTLKEAYVKATGRGILLPLRALHVELAGARPPALVFQPPFADDPSAWRLASEVLHDRHVLGVALRRTGPMHLAIERVAP